MSPSEYSQQWHQLQTIGSTFTKRGTKEIVKLAYVCRLGESESEFEIVHGCFIERGDSILSVFGGELLRLKLQNK